MPGEQERRVRGIDRMFQDYKELRPMLNEVITINDAPFDHWYDQFLTIEIPEGATPPILKDLSARVHKHFQIAATYYLGACAKVAALDARAERKYRMTYAQLINDCIQEGTKPPAATTLDVQAKNAVDYERGVLAVADIERQFWKQIIDHLNRVRKQIETITINLGYEMKVGYTAQSMGGISQDDF
jgi:hypothetical protein